MSNVEVVHPRFVPLGTGDGFQVGRVLPQRALSLIGGWCFLDHFGPGADTMRVAGHPHTCLQTVTWLFSGEIRHQDALGSDIVVRPGEVNLMTAGWGITHTEYSESDEPLHGVQLWTALPEASRFVGPHFEHFATEPVRIDGRGGGRYDSRGRGGSGSRFGARTGAGPGTWARCRLGSA